MTASDSRSIQSAIVASATFLVDAESNLGSALGGMGNMPGMDISAPVQPTDRAPAALPVAPGAKSVEPAPPHDGHRE